MPRAATPKKKATAAKPKKPKAKKATAAKAAAPRRRVTLQPASGETLKQNATQLEVAERMLAEIASREQAETDPAVAAQRALRAAIVSGAIPAGATILKAAPRLKSRNEIDAEARLAADKAAADAAKAANKRLRDTTRATEIATELARILPAPVVMTGAPVSAPASAPALTPGRVPTPSSWLGHLSAALLPPPPEPSTARVRKTAAEKELKRQREATRLATALATALAAAGVSGATSGPLRVATGASVASGPPPPTGGPPPSLSGGPPPLAASTGGPPLPPSGLPPPPVATPTAPTTAAPARVEVSKAMLTGSLSSLKKKTPEEIEADKVARAAKAAAAAAKAASKSGIPKFPSVSERYDPVNKKMERLTEGELPMYKRLAVWRDEAQVAYMASGGIPITKDLLIMGPGGWPIENPAAVAAARAAKAGTSSSAAGTSASASIGTATGPEDPLADKVVLKADGSLFKAYKWNSRALKDAIAEGVIRTGADGRLYRRSLADINAERDAIAAATAASLPKVGPSTVLSAAETTVPVLPTPAPAPHLTDDEIDAILSGEGRGKHSEIQAVGFPQDSWTPAQARKWLRVHDAVPIKGMRREGSWLRWRITPPERYGRYTTKTLRSNGKAVHLIIGWR